MAKNNKNLFQPGKSGNELGRPKGSKNKITVLKLMAEEAARERNKDKAAEVIDLIYQQAMDGDKHSQKLVWASHMSSTNINDKTQTQDKLEININTTPREKDEKVVLDLTPEDSNNDSS